MQDRSHKLLFLGLTGLMSAAAFYGSQAGPTLLVGNDAAPPAVSAAVTARDEDPIVVKLATDGDCREATSDLSALCRAKSKISVSSP